jgi:hypothetical protein
VQAGGVATKSFKGGFQVVFAPDLARKNLRLTLAMAEKPEVLGMIARMINLMRMAQGLISLLACKSAVRRCSPASGQA